VGERASFQKEISSVFTDGCLTACLKAT